MVRAAGGGDAGRGEDYVSGVSQDDAQADQAATGEMRAVLHLHHARGLQPERYGASAGRGSGAETLTAEIRCAPRGLLKSRSIGGSSTAIDETSGAAAAGQTNANKQHCGECVRTPEREKHPFRDDVTLESSEASHYGVKADCGHVPQMERGNCAIRPVSNHARVVWDCHSMDRVQIE